MKTIKDLFIEQKSYIATYELNNGYYLWLECLSENGNTITSHNFDERMLEDNIIVELHHEDFYDSICEWYNCSKFHLNETMDRIKDIMKYAIEQYESEQE